MGSQAASSNQPADWGRVTHCCLTSSSYVPKAYQPSCIRPPIGKPLKEWLPQPGVLGYPTYSLPMIVWCLEEHQWVTPRKSNGSSGSMNSPQVNNWIAVKPPCILARTQTTKQGIGWKPCLVLKSSNPTKPTLVCHLLWEGQKTTLLPISNRGWPTKCQGGRRSF